MAQSLRSQERRARELDPEIIKRRNELFQKYVAPYYRMIYYLTIQYTQESVNVEENYNEVLTNFYRRIETYDPERPIRTWLHIVTKRHIFELEKRRKKHDNADRDDDISSYEEEVPAPDKPSANLMGPDNYKDFYSDEILEVFAMMKPIHRDALILQEAGYSLKEIAEIEFQKGRLKSQNIETIKSRLFLARQFMKKHLTRDGKRKMGQEHADDLHRDNEEG